MMKLFLLISVLLIPLVWSKMDADYSEKQRLQNSAKKMLDFEKLPSKPRFSTLPEFQRPKVSKTANVASHFMRQLFDEYSRMNAKHILPDGNLVRSISPNFENDPNSVMFHLGSIDRNEHILRAHLQFQLHPQHSTGRRRVRKHAGYYAVVQLPGDSQTIDLPAPSINRDYLSWDMLQIVKYLVNVPSSANVTTLKVRIGRHRKHQGHGKALGARKMLQRHTPFLMIFSDAPDIVSRKSSIVEEMKSKKVLQHRAKRSIVHGPPNENNGYYVYQTGLQQRQAHGSDTNPLHVHATLATGPETIVTGPATIFHSRKDMRRNRKLQHKQEKDIQQNGGAVQSDQMFVSIDGQGKAINASDQHVYDGPCVKHELIIEFRDIGWQHWVIAPKTLTADFCAGTCGHPLKPESNPSNHALVQTLLRQAGLDSVLPSVACAPDKMDSMSLLYFDDEDNVVLKNYPKMIVKSCGCM